MKPSRENGFTLLEIVVAVALLGVGLGIAMQIFSAGLKNVHRIDLAQQAMQHAENVMNELLTDDSVRGARTLAGDLDEEFSYTARVDPWTPPEMDFQTQVSLPNLEILSITVDIHFKNDPHGKFYRTVCLKTISPQSLTGPVDSQEAIRQLFGNQ